MKKILYLSTLLYSTLLNHIPDLAGLDYWIAQAHAGGLQAVVPSFLAVAGLPQSDETQVIGIVTSTAALKAAAGWLATY